MTVQLDTADLLRLRLHSQGHTDRSARAPRDAVHRLLAMQAQDFAAALWAIGVRVDGATAASVTRALDEGHIVRSWPMRGTLHFVAAEDLRWMLGLGTPRVIRSMATRHRDLELAHDGVTYWMTRSRLDESASADPGVPGAVLALPGFDEHLLGYAARDLVLPPEHAAKVVPGANGVFLSLITVDGTIVGTWRRATKKGEVVVTPSPFTPMSARTAKRFEGAVSAYAAFLGVTGRVARSHE